MKELRIITSLYQLMNTSDTHRDRGSYFHLRLTDFVQHASRH